MFDFNPYDFVKGNLSGGDYQIGIQSTKNPGNKYKIKLSDFIDVLSFNGLTGGGGDNFANADLTLTADREHDLDSNALTIVSGVTPVATWNATALTLEGDLRLTDNAGGQYVGFTAPASVVSYTWILPATDSAGVLQSDGSGNLSFNTNKADKLAVQAVQTSTFALVAGRLWPIDTTGGAVLMSPPASPVAGQRFAITDADSNWGTNNVTIRFSTSGSTRWNSNASDLTLSTDNLYCEFEYIDTFVGWLLVGGSIA